MAMPFIWVPYLYLSLNDTFVAHSISTYILVIRNNSVSQLGNPYNFPVVLISLSSLLAKQPDCFLSLADNSGGK